VEASATEVAPSRRMPASSSADRAQLETLARAHIDGKDVVKVIVVPAKLVNFVVR